MSKKQFSQWLWDAWCVGSLVGIWPRFIEPTLLSTNHVRISLPSLPDALNNFRIAHFSDLHLHEQTSRSFLGKISQTILNLNPDLILFTGDLICHAKLVRKLELKQFLQSLRAPYGSFGVFGNHDYSSYVSLNQKNQYDIEDASAHFLVRSWRKLWSPKTTAPTHSPRVSKIPHHQELLQLLQETPFRFLENETIQITIKDSKLNLCGLGDYWLDRCLPKTAFSSYNQKFPGIILAHNPDSTDLLQNYPGDLILSGHTHGGQVNIPVLWKKLIGIENLAYKKGLVRTPSKQLYISRGVGCHQTFRLFSLPEITLITLCKP